MSDKPNYLNLFTPPGVAVYPKLTGADPDTKFDSAGLWHTKLAYEPAEIEELIEKLESVRDEFHAQCLEDNKRKYAKYTVADVVEEELDDEGEATGRLILKAKMKAHVTTKAGKEWDQRPRIFDCSAPPKELDPVDLKLWGGSVIRLNVDVVPYAMDSSKTVGVSLRLKAVQVVKLSSGDGGGSPFDSFEGGFTSESSAPEDDSPFDGEDDDGDY